VRVTYELGCFGMSKIVRDGLPPVHFHAALCVVQLATGN